VSSTALLNGFDKLIESRFYLSCEDTLFFFRVIGAELAKPSPPGPKERWNASIVDANQVECPSAGGLGGCFPDVMPSPYV
jgi:hypothetical protein